MNVRVRFTVAMVVLLVLCAMGAYAVPPGFARDFTYKQAEGAVDIMKGDQLVARYVYKDTAKPYIYPLLSPSGLSVTRDYPMKEVANDPTDHPHQKSMWFGFGDVNGVDFWTEGDKCGKIVQTKSGFDSVTPGSYWSIHAFDNWMLPDGKKLCMDERRTAFYSCTSGTLIVSSINIQASEKEITFGDSKEGFFGIRLAPSITLKGGKGHVLNSEGIKDAAAWGKPAKWVDYTGEVNGKTVGVTVFDSHYNVGYPTYWHARDYGLLAANPFGAAAFTGDPKNASPVKIPYGQTLKLIYVTLIHDGKIDAKTLDALCDEVTGRPDKPFMPSDAKNKQQPKINGPSDRFDSAPAAATPATPKEEEKAKPNSDD